ncbi:MAG: PTS sugar transporter subunit IIA [Eubacteriales bacterium]|nr:PTS sugar transporter subunit IIA [Eubacteriales bacterium]
MLLEKITAEDVQIALSAADWEDAIRKAAAPLAAQGAIEQSYVEGMIESVHKNGPYFVLAKGLALAHARPECGANRLALNFTTFDPPVSFGAGDNDPVRLIITLAATDPDSHIDLLGELAEVLMDDTRMQQLFDAPSPDAFRALLLA